MYVISIMVALIFRVLILNYLIFTAALLILKLH